LRRIRRVAVFRHAIDARLLGGSGFAADNGKKLHAAIFQRLQFIGGAAGDFGLNGVALGKQIVNTDDGILFDYVTPK
jgi:hypothetical protein